MKMEKQYNLIPVLDTSYWYTWSSTEAQTPTFSMENTAEAGVLKIISSGKYSFGKWCCEVNGIKSGDTYKFSAEFKTENISCEAVSVSVILSWIKNNGEFEAREYVNNPTTSDSGWNTLSKLICVPAEVSSLKVELALKWPGKEGCILWKRPCLLKTENLGERMVRVATTYINPYLENEINMEQRLSKICNILDAAGNEGADIICLSETINDRALPMNINEMFLPLNCSSTLAIQEKAKLYHCYIIYSFHENDAGSLHNTAILIDRTGNIVGKYRKTHLTLSEGECGMVPGDEYPVFDTDFGRIGILVCWDHFFPEPSRILALKGAEIIFVPTAGDAPPQSITRAIENGIYMVIAGVNKVNDSPLMPSRIINPSGEVIGEVTDENLGHCVKAIDLNKKTYLKWLSVGSCYAEPNNVYLRERVPNTYGSLLGK